MMNGENNLHTISVLVENHFGVLKKVSGLFSARGYNIASLSVGMTEDPTISRMTIVVEGDEYILEQVKKQLNKLIDVIKVVDLTQKQTIERELILIKIEAPATKRAEIMEIVDVFRAKIVDISHKDMVIEATGSLAKVTAFINLVQPFGIKELARTGKVAMERGKK